MINKNNLKPSYFVHHLSLAVGLVLVWRGVWYVLDEIDAIFFGGYSGWTGLIGILVGIAVLYLPDRDLKELDKL